MDLPRNSILLLNSIANSNSTSSTNYLSSDSELENILQHHLDIASDIVPGRGQNQLRSWQNKIQEILAKQNESLGRFLEKPKSEWPSIKQHGKFLNDSVFTSQEWLLQNTEPIVDNDRILEEINQELGLPLSTVQEKIQLVMEKYKATVEQLFLNNESLQKKLNVITSLKKKLDELSDLGLDDAETDKPELLELQTSILKYIQSRYDSLLIRDDYLAFCTSYARFSALRSVMNSLQTFSQHTDALGSPLCTICTMDRINMALIPCGHTFCNICAVKQRSQCYICRTTIREKQKLFFI
jgi:hypothetical protein